MKAKERGILFSTEMVLAVMNGSKTQTRRVVKHNLDDLKLPLSIDAEGFLHSGTYSHLATLTNIKCPYGKVGDLLYVREGLVKFHRDPPTAQYQATGTGVPYREGAKGGHPAGQALWQWKRDSLPSMFMPKWAARTWLRIIGIRVERVRDITPADCEAEGVGYKLNDLGWRYAFGVLWDSINAKRGYPWESNPWVWAIEFEEIK